MCGISFRVRCETKLMTVSLLEDGLLRRGLDDDGGSVEIGVQTQISNQAALRMVELL